MSVVGLARELAASYGLPLRTPSPDNPGRTSEAHSDDIEVAIDSPDCLRFVAQRFEGLRVAPAPAWMRVRLALAGQRPINNVVDVSNYVMLETGQPLHFYDAAAIGGSKLVVRDARAGERLETLDGVERSLTPQALVIANDERALGLAGLMGGAASEVTPVTTAIVLEAANFNGPRVRRMGGALGLRTEASSRHEKSLAPALADAGAARAAQLLCALGAVAGAPRAFGAPLEAANPIALRVAGVERLLGLRLPAERIAEHLRALGCEVAHADAGTLAVTPPAWRRDLTIAADLVEEVARIEGYDRIEPAVPSVPAHEISSAAFAAENRIARALAGLGYQEVVTHSLRGDGEGASVEIQNPLSEEHRFLRESLVPGLIAYLARVATPARVFEIGDVFRREGEGVIERTALAFGFSAEPSGTQEWRDSSFLRLKGDCEALLRAITGLRAETAHGSAAGFHPGKTASMTVEGRAVATLGCVDPRAAKAAGLKGNAYLCVVDVASLPPHRTPHYRPPSRFPSTYRDLALVVDAALEAAALEAAVVRAIGPLCTGVNAFDEFRGSQVPDGRKSLALRVSLQRFDATITDEEADAAIALALDSVREQFGATIRT
jgi:phenylalanyl-tRNA synthetase beta chain